MELFPPPPFPPAPFPSRQFPPPPPPRPPVRHPTLWPQDTYTREEINAKDAATLEAAKKYVDDAADAAAEKAIGDSVAAANDAKVAAESAATQAGGSAEAAAASAEGAAAAASTAAAAAVSGARKVVESPDGEKRVTVTDGGDAVLAGDGVRIVFKFSDEAEETTLYRYGDTDWYLRPGDTPPTDGSNIQTFPTPCAQYGTYETIYRKVGGTVVEYGLVDHYNSSSYIIRSNGSSGSTVGYWRFEGVDEARVVTRADLRRIACGCNDATMLLQALRGIAD